MSTFNIRQARTHLSRLLERAAAGEEIVIAKAGIPLARLIPIAPPLKPRKPGRLKISLPDSLFEPLPDEELRAWER